MRATHPPSPANRISVRAVIAIATWLRGPCRFSVGQGVCESNARRCLASQMSSCFASYLETNLRHLRGRTRMPLIGKRRLFVKYVASITAIVGAALLLNTVLEAVLYRQSQMETLARLQRESVDGAAERVSRYVAEVQGQLAWATHVPWIGDVLEQKELDATRLL